MTSARPRIPEILMARIVFASQVGLVPSWYPRDPVANVELTGRGTYYVLSRKGDKKGTKEACQQEPNSVQAVIPMLYASAIESWAFAVQRFARRLKHSDHLLLFYPLYSLQVNCK
jgi:hypothetical protein